MVIIASVSCSNQQKTSSLQTEEDSIEELTDSVSNPDEDYDIENEPDSPPFEVEAVDLGLSVLWANANIGAYDIFDKGEYYAWGESSPKSSYTLDNYFDYYIEVKEGGYVHRGYRTFTKAGQSLVGTEYDTAHNLLGDGWRMPTSDEYNELINKCSVRHQWKKDKNGNALKDENGNLTDYVEVVGSNGKKIIFPYTGYKSADDYDRGDGYYWTANMPHRGSDKEYALAACLGNYTRGPMSINPKDKGYGLCIRAVKERNASAANISDGEYEMEGRIGSVVVRIFKLVIEGSHVSGNFLYQTASFNNHIYLEGTKDEHNNISLKETTNRGENMGNMEGVFDGKTFHGTDYHVDGEGFPFKVIVK